MRRLLIAASIALGTAAGQPARAQDATEQAARTFRTGAGAYARGDFAAAARAFEAAYRMAPRGAAVYNAGLAWEGAGDPAHAADDYAATVGALDARPEQRADASSRLRALEARLSRLVVTGPPDAHVSVDGAPDAPLPIGVHLAPGRHALRATYANGRGESRAFEADAGGEVEVRVGEPSEPPSASTAPAPPAPPPPASTARAARRSSEEPAPAARRPPRAERPADDPGAATRRSLAWVALGGAVVASGAAILFYEDGLAARNRFTSGGSADTDLHDQAANLRTLSQVAWGVAGALGASAFVLFLSSSTASPVTTALRVGPRGLDLRIRF